MESEEIRKAVLATIESIAPETDAQCLRPDLPLRAQIDLDSMDWLNVIVGLCGRLSIEIPQSDHGRLATLDSIVAYLIERRAPRPGAQTPRAATAPAGLPSTRHVIDGVAVTIRPIRRDDLQREADFIQHLSKETRYKRFLVTVGELSDRKLHYFTEVDQVGHVALVATIERNGDTAIIGVARYIVDRAGTGCEFAIAIDDAWQGTGLAGVLMHSLIEVARSRGLATMEGTVLTTNTRMLKFMRQLGFRQQRDADDRDTIRVALDLRAAHDRSAAALHARRGP